MSEPRVYLHELIDIVGQGRAAYNEHMCAYAPTALEERRLKLVGNFSTVGTTERWPESVNLWEFLDGWDGVARNFRHEFANPVHQDKNLVPWWSEALKYRSGGYDRLMLASAKSPTADQLIERGVTGECYYHEHVTVKPGTAARYLDIVDHERSAVAATYGWGLVGAYRHALVNDSEAIVIWAIPTWEHWAEWEQVRGADRDVRKLMNKLSGIVVDWRAKLLVASAQSPLGNTSPR